MATYYATKSYMASLTSAVAVELKQQGSNVYVGALCPGPVDTEFNDIAGVKFALPGITPEYCVSYAIKQMKKRKVIITPKMVIVNQLFLVSLLLVSSCRYIMRSIRLSSLANFLFISFCVVSQSTICTYRSSRIFFISCISSCDIAIIHPPCCFCQYLENCPDSSL